MTDPFDILVEYTGHTLSADLVDEISGRLLREGLFHDQQPQAILRPYVTPSPACAGYLCPACAPASRAICRHT